MDYTIKKTVGKKNKELPEQLANVGDIIEFKRGDTFTGIVFQQNENSICIEIDDLTARILDYSTNRTVVGHKNYKILKQAAI